MIDSKNISVFLNKLHKKNFGKNIFLFSMGLLISAFAFNLFFAPYKVVPTGSSGLALLIGNYVKISDSLIILLISLVCLLLGLIFFGYDYGAKMLFFTLIYPSFVSATTLITRYIDLEDTSLFLLMVFGGGMMGLSSGLIRKSGFSPGGFCVLYDLMNKYFHLSVGVASTIINTLLILGSSFIFGMESAIYALVSLMISSYIVDRVTIGISDNKVFYIVTSKYLEVSEHIMDDLNYSVTLLNARGGYTNKKRKMLMCVVPTIEYVKLKEVIQAIDPKAFFLIVDTYSSSVKKICKNM